MLELWFLQSALIFAKFYTKAQLSGMNLPKQLYKCLNTFLFSSEGNTIQYYLKPCDIYGMASNCFLLYGFRRPCLLSRSA